MPGTTSIARQSADRGDMGGLGEPLNRLLMGYSTMLPQILQNTLRVPPQTLPNTMQALQAALTAPLVMPAMPLQNAIDLAEFMVDVTIKWVRFSPGPPFVAGPIELAAISKHEGFRWIRRKYYFSTDLNPDLKAEDRWNPKPEAEA